MSGSSSIHGFEFLRPNRNRILTDSNSGSNSKTKNPIQNLIFWPQFRSEPDRDQVYFSYSLTFTFPSFFFSFLFSFSSLWLSNQTSTPHDLATCFLSLSNCFLLHDLFIKACIFFLYKKYLALFLHFLPKAISNKQILLVSIILLGLWNDDFF